MFLHILSIYPQTNFGISSPLNKKGVIPSCTSSPLLPVNLGHAVIASLGVHLRLEWWTVTKPWYSSVMHKLLPKNSPRLFHISANPAKSKAGFQPLKLMQELLEVVQTEPSLWKLKSHFKAIWYLSRLVFLSSGRGGRRWLFGSEAVHTSNEVWMANQVSTQSNTLEKD